MCGIKNPRGREHLLALQDASATIVVADAAERDWLDLHVNHGFQALMSTPALALYQTPGNLPIVEYTRLADRGSATARGPARGVFEKWMRRPWLDGGVIPIAQLKAWLELLGLPQGPVRVHWCRSARSAGVIWLATWRSWGCAEALACHHATRGSRARNLPGKAGRLALPPDRP